jgi:hypothetical protein
MCRLRLQRRTHGISPCRDVLKTPRGTYLFISRSKVGSFDYDDEIIEADTRGDILWAWSANKNLAGGGHFPSGGLQGLTLTDDGGLLVVSCATAEAIRVEYPSGLVAWRRELALKPLSVSAMPGGGALVSGEDFQDARARIAVLDGTGAEIFGRRFEFDARGAFSASKISPGGGWLITDGAAGEVIEYTEDFTEVMRVRFLKTPGRGAASGGGFPNDLGTRPALCAERVESLPSVKKPGGFL